jgi:hypothetical protein
MSIYIMYNKLILARTKVGDKQNQYTIRLKIINLYI